MGLDVSSFVAYGDFLEVVLILDDESKDDKLFFTDELGRLCYDYEVADERGITIINEPYDLDWLFIGVPFLGKTPEETIENLKTVKDKWEELIKELKEASLNCEESIKKKINELEPAIVEESDRKSVV